MARTEHRSIRERWIITGTLTLETPAHFGNGEADALTDMPLVLNEIDGRPLLPGTSIAGALRNSLRELEAGFGQPLPAHGTATDEEKSKERGLLTNLLFGGYRGDEEGLQSPLIVDDAVGTASDIELRDGVAIEAATRTAADDKKFDIQLLAAGTTFPLRFELLIGEHPNKPDTENRQMLLQALGAALHGLEAGQITLGARKRRGFGRVSVKDWLVCRYDLGDRDQFLAWLASGRWDAPSVPVSKGDAIIPLLGVDPLGKDGRRVVHLKATFALDGTLMIRSGFGEADTGPDMVHLHSPRKAGRVPVIPGTSWAGVLRHRALKIARTLWGPGNPACQSFVDGIFGPSQIKKGDKHARASRLVVSESEVQKVASLVQTRIKIDRFTGGAFESALFSEQPLVGKEDTLVPFDLALRIPVDYEGWQAEAGLLLLLLKDLWTGELPVGGESGIGRGRLRGLEASLETPDGDWTIQAVADGKLSISDPDKLEAYVKAFNERTVSHD